MVVLKHGIWGGGGGTSLMLLGRRRRLSMISALRGALEMESSDRTRAIIVSTTICKHTHTHSFQQIVKTPTALLSAGTQPPINAHRSRIIVTGITILSFYQMNSKVNRDDCSHACRFHSIMLTTLQSVPQVSRLRTRCRATPEAQSPEQNHSVENLAIQGGRWGEADLAGVSLGGGHPDLAAGVDVHPALAGPGDSAAHGVGDSDAQGAPLLRVCESLHTGSYGL